MPSHLSETKLRGYGCARPFDRTLLIALACLAGTSGIGGRANACAVRPTFDPQKFPVVAAARIVEARYTEPSPPVWYIPWTWFNPVDDGPRSWTATARIINVQRGHVDRQMEVISFQNIQSAACEVYYRLPKRGDIWAIHYNTRSDGRPVRVSRPIN